jgi:hypothetical protein
MTVCFENSVFDEVLALLRSVAPAIRRAVKD